MFGHAGATLQVDDLILSSGASRIQAAVVRGSSGAARLALHRILLNPITNVVANITDRMRRQPVAGVSAGAICWFEQGITD